MKKFFVIIALIGLSITPLHVYAQASNEPLNISIRPLNYTPPKI